MIQLSFPAMLVAVCIPLIGGLFFPLLEKKLTKGALAFTSFALLLMPPVTALALILKYGLGDGILDSPFFFFEAVGTFSMYLDWLSGLYLLGVGVVTPAVALYSYPYMKHRIRTMQDEGHLVPSLGTFYMLYMVFAASMSGTVLSTNLIQFYVFLKLTVVSSFFLILLYGYGERSRTAMMYLIWSSLAGVFYLVGSLAVGASVGTFDIINFDTLEVNLAMGVGLPVLIPFAIFFGLMIKKAIFGVHMWLPYAHAEAPTPVSALLSPNLIGISGWAMIRIVMEMFPHQFQDMSVYLLVLSYGTMIYGGLMALAQNEFKRLLAYVSVSQMGWVVFGLATMTTEGMVGGVLLFVKHSLSLSVLFMSAGLLISRHNNLKYISDMGGFLSKIPMTSGLTALGFLILAGVPFTIGFWTKTLIFSGATKMPLIEGTGTAGFLIVSALIVVAACVTAAYTFITLKRMLFGEVKGIRESVVESWNQSTIPMAVIGGIGVAMFFVPSLYIGPAKLPSVPVILAEAVVFIAAYVGAFFVFQGWPQKLARGLFDRFEVRVVDNLYHDLTVSAVMKVSALLNGVHTGVLNTYLLWMLSGFLLITLLLMN